MTAVLPTVANRIVLNHIGWETFQSLARDWEAWPGRKLAYDNGILEIMTPSGKHEESKEVLGRLVETTTKEMGLEVLSLGQKTWNRQDLLKGAEADKCFYIQNEELVRGKDDIDLSQDPPPDLVIEIDITSSSTTKLAIYAAMGVPEVWRYDGQRLEIRRLEGEDYTLWAESAALPILTVKDIERILNARKDLGQNTLFTAIEKWLRLQLQEKQKKDLEFG